MDRDLSGKKIEKISMSKALLVGHHTHLLSSAMHNLIIRPAINLPESALCRMRNKQVFACKDIKLSPFCIKHHRAKHRVWLRANNNDNSGQGTRKLERLTYFDDKFRHAVLVSFD